MPDFGALNTFAINGTPAQASIALGIECAAASATSGILAGQIALDFLSATAAAANGDIPPDGSLHILCAVASAADFPVYGQYIDLEFVCAASAIARATLSGSLEIRIACEAGAAISGHGNGPISLSIVNASAAGMHGTDDDTIELFFACEAASAAQCDAQPLITIDTFNSGQVFMVPPRGTRPRFVGAMLKREAERLSFTLDYQLFLDWGDHISEVEALLLEDEDEDDALSVSAQVLHGGRHVRVLVEGGRDTKHYTVKLMARTVGNELIEQSVLCKTRESRPWASSYL